MPAITTTASPSLHPALKHMLLPPSLLRRHRAHLTADGNRAVKDRMAAIALVNGDMRAATVRVAPRLDRASAVICHPR